MLEHYLLKALFLCMTLKCKSDVHGRSSSSFKLSNSTTNIFSLYLIMWLILWNYWLLSNFYENGCISSSILCNRNEKAVKHPQSQWLIVAWPWQASVFHLLSPAIVLPASCYFFILPHKTPKLFSEDACLLLNKNNSVLGACKTFATLTF